jgi:mannosylglycoprotein endo-beta-mannosidase
MDMLKRLDEQAEGNGLTPQQWQERYHIESQLEKIYIFEEIQWQRRGGVNWILKGDSNSRYFHGVANGRKKKCAIFSLEEEGREIRDPAELKTHVEAYYKELFGKEPEGSISLEGDFWAERGRLSQEEAQELIRPFTLKELEEALKEMDENAAPGPDGLPMGFYKEFCRN